MATTRPPARRIILVVVLLLALGLILWWALARGNGDEQRVASGSVEATEYQVAAAIGGRISAVLVEEGAQVKKDQVLVRLDPAALDLQVTQAREGVNAANAALRQARNDGTSAEVAEARARVQQAQASVDLAKVQQGYATITAPHAGTVTVVSTNAGQNAAPGRSLLTITDTGDVYARVFVPEPQLGSVTVGSAATITGDGVPQADGTVTFVSSQAEFTPNNVQTQDQRTKLVYQVRVKITDTSGAFKPGFPVDVRFS